jgi:hypothetical protein
MRAGEGAGAAVRAVERAEAPPAPVGFGAGPVDAEVPSPAGRAVVGDADAGGVAGAEAVEPAALPRRLRAGLAVVPSGVACPATADAVSGAATEPDAAAVRRRVPARRDTGAAMPTASAVSGASSAPSSR